MAHKIRVPPHQYDEALSEGLVALTLGYQRYRPELGIPIGAWLSKCIRWGLRNWQRVECHQIQSETISEQCQMYVDGFSSILLAETLITAKRALTEDEYTALIGKALGMRINELSTKLHLNGKQINELAEEAREKLRKELKMV